MRAELSVITVWVSPGPDMEPRMVTPLLSVLVIAAGVAQAMGHTEQPQSAAQPRTRWLKVKRNTDGAPASGKQLKEI